MVFGALSEQYAGIFRTQAELYKQQVMERLAMENQRFAFYGGQHSSALGEASSGLLSCSPQEVANRIPTIGLTEQLVERLKERRGGESPKSLAWRNISFREELQAETDEWLEGVW